MYDTLLHTYSKDCIY